MVFELYDDPGEPGGPDLDKEARLVQLLDRNGQGTTITYSGSDTREIDTVTDRYGYTMTVAAHR